MVAKHNMKVRADLKRNCLHVTLGGTISKPVLESLYTEIRFCVADLKPGFTVIGDYSTCRFGYLSGLGTYAKIREYLAKNGVGKVYRVAGKQGLIIAQLTHLADLGANYDVTYVKTLAEAEQMLAAESAAA